MAKIRKDSAAMHDDPENAAVAPATVIEPPTEAERKRCAEIEAAIRALPILPEEEWQVPYIVEELCLRAKILSASKGDGRAPPQLRLATRQMTVTELKELGRRMFDLAQKLERSVRTKRARDRLDRARERLARFIEGLHAPTIETLSCAPALKVAGRPILADINYFENRLPKKLLENGSDLSALEMRYWGALASLASNLSASQTRYWGAAASLAEIEAAEAAATEAESGDPLKNVFAMFPELKLNERLKPDTPRYAKDIGRPPNRQVHAIADQIVRAWALTGQDPIFRQWPCLGEDKVHGPFIAFARDIFAIMGIRHDALRYVSVAAFARRGRGRKQ